MNKHGWKKKLDTEVFPIVTNYIKIICTSEIFNSGLFDANLKSVRGNVRRRISRALQFKKKNTEYPSE